MKKKTKTIIGLILAFIIGISTTVTAATVFNSKDITYSSTATTKKNVKDSLDELYGKVGKCPDGYTCYKPIAEQIKIGDYISMTPTSTSYTISKDLTGYTSDQTINPSELNLWRVIKVNEDGTVEMVSDRVSSKKIRFSGLIGYRFLVNTLNAVASQYTDNAHVQGTRYIGYQNQTNVISEENFPTDYQKISLGHKKSTDNSSWISCDSKKYLCGRDESTGYGDRGFEQDYSLVTSVYGDMISLDVEGNKSRYFLCSRFYYYLEGYSVEYKIRMVTDAGRLTTTGSIYAVDTSTGTSDPTAYQGDNSLRIIVTLRAKTGIESGSGSRESPYILV